MCSNSRIVISSKVFHKIYTFITFIFVCLFIATIFTSKEKGLDDISLATKILLGIAFGILSLNCVFAGIYYFCNGQEAEEEGFEDPLV